MIDTPRILYHVTLDRNVDHILQDGLKAQVGDRSQKMGEKRGIFLFHDLEDLSDALANWLGDEFDPMDTLSILQITLPADFPELTSDAGFERVTQHPIPSRYLSVLLEDADDLEFDTSSRRDPLIEATLENIEKARDFVLARWIERSLERFPNRPVPTDLTDACKFSSLFAQHLFGGDIVANEDHQFVMLPGGYVLDLNKDAGDVAEIEDPYHQDLTIQSEPEWQASMESIRPRVEAWVEHFQTDISPRPASM